MRADQSKPPFAPMRGVGEGESVSLINSFKYVFRVVQVTPPRKFRNRLIAMDLRWKEENL